MRTTDIEVSTLRFGNPSIRRLLLRLERPSPVAWSGQLRGKDAVKSAIDESPLGTTARWSRCADLHRLCHRDAVLGKGTLREMIPR